METGITVGIVLIIAGLFVYFRKPIKNVAYSAEEYSGSMVGEVLKDVAKRNMRTLQDFPEVFITSEDLIAKYKSGKMKA